MQEITHNSFGGNIIESLKGIFVGFILIIIAIVGLYINEGGISPKEIFAKANIINSTDTNTADGIVIVEGNPVINNKLSETDNQYLAPLDSIYLQRKVEVYAWQEVVTEETKENVGGSTDTIKTYSYKKDWTVAPVDSSVFKDKSPEYKNIIPAIKGALYSQPFTINGLSVGQLSDGDKVYHKELLLTPDLLKDKTNKIVDNRIYIKNGTNTAEANIGDIRISYNVIDIKDKISVFGEKRGNNISLTVNYKDNIEKGLIGIGDHNTILDKAVDEFKFNTWLFRGIGFAVIWIGLILMTSIVSTLASVLPFLGSLTRGVLFIINGIIAFALSSLVILVAIVLHNIIALIVSIIIFIIILYFIFQRKKSMTNNDTK